MTCNVPFSKYKFYKKNNSLKVPWNDVLESHCEFHPESLVRLNKIPSIPVYHKPPGWWFAVEPIPPTRGMWEFARIFLVVPRIRSNFHVIQWGNKIARKQIIRLKSEQRTWADISQMKTHKSNGLMKNCSVSLIIMQRQIKTTMRCHHTPARMVVRKNTSTTRMRRERTLVHWW